MSRRRSKPNAERRLQRGAASRWRGNRIFYVAVEGERTEPDYLSYLNREFGAEHQFFVHPIHRANGMAPGETVARVIEERENDGGDEPQTQYWAMFDRDEHPDVAAALRTANRHGIRVAFSHPSFDLWLLLHFIPVSERQHGSSQWIQQKLRQQHAFGRFGSASGEKSLNNTRAAAIADKHEVAARRARQLVDDCPSRRCSAATGHVIDCDPLKRDPSTDVWCLLAELGAIAQPSTDTSPGRDRTTE